MTSNYFPKDQADLGNLEVGNLTHLFSLIVWTSVGIKFVLKSIYFSYNIPPKDVHQCIPSSGRLSLKSSLAGPCSVSYFYWAWYALAACLYTDWAVKCMLLSPESRGNLRTTKDDKSGFLNIFPNSKGWWPRWRAKPCKCPSEHAMFASLVGFASRNLGRIFLLVDSRTFWLIRVSWRHRYYPAPRTK